MVRGLCLLTVMAVLAAATTLTAQWPTHVNEQLPRLADGSVNLSAPAPRAADGHVDFSGVWAGPGYCLGDSPSLLSSASNSAGSTGPRPSSTMTFEGRTVPLATCFNVGAAISGGVPLQAWADELKRQRGRDNQIDSPQAHCLPIGPVQLWLNNQPREIVQTPRQLVVMWEANQGLRRIFTDGRPSPDNDPQPWWYGYSVGRWDGDTLVVTTTNLKDAQWLDINGTPLTAQARITERMRRATFGTIDIEMTFDDPGAFTRPFSVGLQQHLVPDQELIEFVCENEQSSKHYVRP
jgi:hypothetical protein